MDTCDGRFSLEPLKIKTLLLKAVLLCLPVLFPPIVTANNEILVGMSAAFSGLNADLGRGMKNGIELGFAEVNANGGIQGRTLRLVVKDDAYEPLRAAENMRELIDEDNVVAILGNTGTPTAVLTVPIANEEKLLMFGAYTGAGLLRKAPPDCCIYNYRASYKEEAMLMVNHLLDSGIKPEEIAFFTQRDSYGDAGYQGAVEQLQSRGYIEAEWLAHGRYQRNTLNVEQAVADLLVAEVEPKAVIMVGSYAAAAKFIKLMKMDLPNLLFLNISFTGSDSLLRMLGKDAEGVIITQVVPNMASGLPIVQSYLKQISSSPLLLNPNVISLEGYIVARIFIDAARKIKGDVNQASLLTSMGNFGRLDIGLGVDMILNEAHHQASYEVWMSQIRKGRFVDIGSKKNDYAHTNIQK